MVLEIGDEQLEILANEAMHAEEAIMKSNIYRAKTYNCLARYENRINEIAEHINVSVKDILESGLIKTPWDLLNEAIDHWDKVLEIEAVPSDDDLADHLERALGLEIKKAKSVFVPPDAPGKNGDESIASEMPIDANRVVIAIETILKNQIAGKNTDLDSISLEYGTIPDSPFRKKSYWVIDLKDLKVAVLVNNQAENRTFVLIYDTDDDLQRLASMTKNELKGECNGGLVIHHFAFRETERFKEELLDSLTDAALRNKRQEMDRDYFSDIDAIRYDLTEFAKVSGKPDIEGLTINAMVAKRAKCKSGKIKVGVTYLSDAGFMLDLAENRAEAVLKKREILKFMKSLVGVNVEDYEQMDKNYFSLENIANDLEQYRQASGCPELKDLYVSLDGNIEVECANGETVRKLTYLNRAGVALGYAEKAHHMYGKYSRVMKHLLSLLGIAVIEKQLRKGMEKDYFTPENIKYDLEQFALGSHKTGIEELRVSADFLTKAVCRTGEKITFITYLGRAGHAFGMIKKNSDVNLCRGQILIVLQNLIGMPVEEKPQYPEMNSEYFTAENIEKDLRTFAEKAGLECVEKLTTNNIDNTTAVCTNGENVRGGNYILRAGKALRNKSGKDARKIGAIILNQLKRRMGIDEEELIEYSPMDKQYFNRENVTADLTEYIKITNVSSIEDLNTKKMSLREAVLCQNGEMTTGQTYLYRAGKALGFGQSGRKAHSKMGEIMKQLQRIAGLEVPQTVKYPAMNREYFSVEMVRGDLDGFAKAAKIDDRRKLNMNNGAMAKNQCVNGETITLRTYVNRYCVAFGFVDQQRKASKKFFEMLDKLNDIADGKE